MATWARVKDQVSHTVFLWKKVCQNFVPVTFIPTAHSQQSLVAKVTKSSDRSIHQGANIQVLRHTLFVLSHMVSPPQMPVLLKRMYNANIPRAEITTFVPSCPPMLHTIIKTKLSFFQNCFENGMLTSCVLSYAPMLVKRYILPRSPKIFLSPFPEKTQILLTACVHPKISHNSYTSYHR